MLLTLFRSGSNHAAMQSSEEVALWVPAYRASIVVLEDAERRMHALLGKLPADLRHDSELDDLSVVEA